MRSTRTSDCRKVRFSFLKSIFLHRKLFSEVVPEFYSSPWPRKNATKCWTKKSYRKPCWDVENQTTRRQRKSGFRELFSKTKSWQMNLLKLERGRRGWTFRELVGNFTGILVILKLTRILSSLNPWNMLTIEATKATVSNGLVLCNGKTDVRNNCRPFIINESVIFHKRNCSKSDSNGTMQLNVHRSKERLD